MGTTSFVQRLGRYAAAAATALAVWSGSLHAQATGRITGRITDPGGAPLQGARITVAGTSIVTGSAADGRFTLVGVPAGVQEVRVAILGFAALRRSVTVASGQTATIDFQLTTAPVQLAGVVTTATGEQRKVELGHNVSQIDAADRVLSAPVANMSDLLQSQAPGVQVLQSAMTGGSQRIRIRGTNSISLSNEPIFVIDGIRMTSDNNSSSIGVGGTNPSRLSDLNPEEIESIEIVKGPAAATLYGTDAANGVILVKTKRGRAGPARWTLYAEGGAIKDYNKYWTNYRGWRTGGTAATNSAPTNAVQCYLFQVAAGTCVQDSVSRFNLFEDKDSSPYSTGTRQQYGLQVSGGSEAVRYFVSSEWEDEVGIIEMPQFAIDSTRARRGVDPLREQLRPNALRKTSVRANLNTDLRPNLDVAVSTAFITSKSRLPQTDNNVTGLIGNTSGGPGNKTNGLMGYRSYTPDRIFAEITNQGINRFIGSGTTNYRPTNWLSGRATAGIDFTSRVDTDLCIRDQCVAFSTYPTGFKADNRTEFFRYTADASATATFRPFSLDYLESKTTIGTQWVKSVFDRNGAYGENLPPGTTQLDAGSIPSVEEVRDESKTLGAFVEEQVAFRDRLFITGAIRADDNSAFGKNYNAVYYPKAQISWLASEETFFPRPSWLGTLRLRVAVGASGTQPGTTDALRFFAATSTTFDNVDEPAVTFSALGNDDLRPERATEREGGFDLGAWNDRLSLEFTYYNRLTKDALIDRPLPPSGGVAVSVFDNIGSVRNSGFEYSINARPIERAQFGLDLKFSGSTNKNKLVELGQGIEPIIGATRQQREGYPLDGFWQRKILSYGDTDGDGIVELGEISVSDTNMYVGPDKPTREMSFQVGMDLLRRRLRLSALMDHKGGHYLLNGTERIRCESRNNCRGLNDPTASVFEQARVVAVRLHPSRTQAGFMEKADFIRLRELGLNYSLPEKLVGIAKASSATFTAAVRNIKIWTDYSGVDPESNYFGGSLGTVSDFQTAPPPTYFTFRLVLGL